MGSSTRVLASGMISTAFDPRYAVIWKSTKLVDFIISGRFLGLQRVVFAPGTISMAHDPWYMVIWKST